MRKSYWFWLLLGIIVLIMGWALIQTQSLETSAVAARKLVGIVIVALSVTYWAWGPWLLSQLSDLDMIVTTVKENQLKVVMRFGRVWRIIGANPSEDPDPRKNWDVRRKIGKNRTRNADGLQFLLFDFFDRDVFPGGLRLVGLPFMDTIFEYHFRWRVLRDSKPRDDEFGSLGVKTLRNGKYAISFDQKLDYIFRQSSFYFMEIVGAETRASDLNAKDTSSIGMPLDVYINVLMRIVNPYYALFSIHDWLQSTNNMVEPAFRRWIGQHTYPEIVGRPEVVERDFDTFLHQATLTEAELASEIKKLTPEAQARVKDRKPRSIGDYLEVAFGVCIEKFAVDDIIPDKLYQDEAVKRAASEQEAVRIVNLAEADKKADIARGQGEAGRLAEVLKEMEGKEEIAMRLRELEVIQSIGIAGNTIVTSGNAPLMLSAPLRTEKK